MERTARIEVRDTEAIVSWIIVMVEASCVFDVISASNYAEASPRKLCQRLVNDALVPQEPETLTPCFTSPCQALVEAAGLSDN